MARSQGDESVIAGGVVVKWQHVLPWLEVHMWSVLTSGELIQRYFTVLIYMIGVLIILVRWPKLPRQ